jgi:hypothetical protein
MPDALSREARREASIWHVFSPKLIGGRRRAAENPSVGKTVLLLGTALIFWLVLYRVIVRMLEYFRATAGIGDVLATKLLGLILLGFLSVLVLSNLITALSSFFLSKDIDLLVAAPIDGLKVYAARLIEMRTSVVFGDKFDRFARVDVFMAAVFR